MNTQALKNARELGYLVSAGNDPDLQRAWLEEVHALGVPYVEIILSLLDAREGAGAKLLWETPHMAPHITIAAQAITWEYRNHSPDTRVHFGETTSCAIGPIPLDVAKEIAGKILDLSPSRRVS